MRRFTIETRGDTFSEQLKQTLVLRLTELDFLYDYELPELVITIGGDGTFLRAIHKHVNRISDTAFVGIHTEIGRAHV